MQSVHSSANVQQQKEHSAGPAGFEDVEGESPPGLFLFKESLIVRFT